MSKVKESSRYDHLVQGLFHAQALRAAICDVSSTVAEAQKRHQLDPLATITLGRALAVCALMGSSLKAQDAYIQCHFRGDGPIGSVIAEFIAPASLRGFVAVPQLASQQTVAQALPQSVGAAVGQGILMVKVGRKDGMTVHSGICQLRSGEIAEDVAHYYAESEQIPTILGAGVTLSSRGEVLGAGGILIQKVGGACVDAGLLERLEEKVRHGQALSQQIAQNKSPEAILLDFAQLAPPVSPLKAKPLGFHCFCNRSRMAMALLSLGEEELRRIKAECGEISTYCHFCAERFLFELSDFFPLH